MFDHDRYEGSSPTSHFETRKLRQILKGVRICEAHKRKRYVDTERDPKCNVNRNAKKRNEYLNKRCQKRNSRAIISII